MSTIGQIWPRNSGGGGGGDSRLAGYEDFADAAFDPSFAFTYSGTPWARASDLDMFTGVASLKSAPIGHGLQTSCFVDFTVPSGKVGVFTTVMKASSEGAAWDYIRAYVGAAPLFGTGDDYSQQSNVGGNSPWATISQRFLAGAHTVEFRYQKDGSGVAGFDAGYIDSLAVVLHDT